MVRKPSANDNDKMFGCPLTSNILVSPGVHVISFERNFSFIPGQVIKIGVDYNHPPRIYSICSGNREKQVRILFNVKEDGLLTPQLAKMNPGEKILVSEPYGSFLSSDEPAWWIAAGTGIAPFYSMFRSGLGMHKKLIHGCRFLNQFYFQDEFQKVLGKNYVRCASQQLAKDVYFGRVTDYLAEIKQFPDVMYYICGRAIMVVEVRDLLIEKGVPFSQIFSEIYF